MKNYWLSWWTNKEQGAFELYWPWWISGSRYAESGTVDASICAAIQAESEEAAMEIVLASFDVRPEHVEFRFVEERPAGWSPYTNRFEKADWMREWDASGE